MRATSVATVRTAWKGSGGKMLGDTPPASAARGYCDRDYPRTATMSPYGFKTAQAHYEALLQETRDRGGPTVHTYATVPGDWGGRYLWRRGGGSTSHLTRTDHGATPGSARGQYR